MRAELVEAHSECPSTSSGHICVLGALRQAQGTYTRRLRMVSLRRSFRGVAPTLESGQVIEDHSVGL